MLILEKQKKSAVMNPTAPIINYSQICFSQLFTLQLYNMDPLLQELPISHPTTTYQAHISEPIQLPFSESLPNILPLLWCQFPLLQLLEVDITTFIFTDKEVEIQKG